jgi:hypothetical protein
MVSGNKNQTKGLKIALFSKCLFWGFFLLFISTLWQCANMQQPTGGPIDSIPPVVVQELPQNLTRNLTARKITIQFNENIKVNNPQQQISITPDMDTFPKFRAKKRNLEITLPDTLAENTTYMINFGEGLVDYNESNPIKNYSYIFSTGDEIDSLSISGQVMDSYTNLPDSTATVLLIPVSQDSIFGKKKANIFTRVDSKGLFKLNYLSENTYRIYAITEKNGNRIFDAPGEALGFIADSIYLNKDTTGILLRTSVLAPKDFRILQKNIEANGRITLVSNKRIEQPKIVITHPKEYDADKLVHWNKTHDTLYMWIPKHDFDSIKMQVFDGDRFIDSTLIRHNKSTELDRSFLVFERLKAGKVDRTKHVELIAPVPIDKIDRSKIILKEDSLQHTNYQFLKDSLDNSKFVLRYNWKAKATYTLKLEPGAFIGPYGDTNKENEISFTLNSNDIYGDLELSFNLPDTTEQYIVEFVSDQGKVVMQRNILTKASVIPYLKYPEGKYQLRIIYDHNKNGRWDPGKLEEKIQPETIWYFDKTIIIRPNWQQQETINIPKDAYKSPSFSNQEE